ncbi:flavin-containing monooxygenase [Exilibacterium tricleocarpae]|nr:NAD(P)/FAD-dependent oxidoreductase [Exilibacterium tricleocarpae]
MSDGTQTGADPIPTHVDVAIIGTGFSGLGMAIKLKQAGRDNFVLLEKDEDLGGCWRDNTYPGCCCDIPSHLYSFSFEQVPSWTRKYPRQEEIHTYLRHCADKYGIQPHVRYRSEVVKVTFCDASGFWQLHLNGGTRLTARVVMAGMGPLHRPAIPALPGLESFKGTRFHSSHWNHAADLNDKRVAVIGTGASAIQFVPQIAPRVKALHLFQRTPPWIMPRPDREMTNIEKWCFTHLPVTQQLYRRLLYWRHEFRGRALNEKSWIHKHAQRMAANYLKAQIADPVLREKLTPQYSLGCKRVLISNDYYPAMCLDNLDLITSPVTEIRGNTVVAEDGSERDVDAIVFGTGFAAADPLQPDFLYGPGGLDLYRRWQEEGAQAYKGVSVAGLPNFFFLIGPNSGLGHNSMILMIEAQIQYILQCLDYMDQHGVRHWDVRRREQDAYNDELQARVGTAVWSSGCRSWYLNKDGRNTTIWPGFVHEYEARMRKLAPQVYEATS